MKEGYKLQKLLKIKGISAVSAAEKLSVSRGQVYNYFKSEVFQEEVRRSIEDNLGFGIEESWDELPEKDKKKIEKEDEIDKAESILLKMQMLQQENEYLIKLLQSKDDLIEEMRKKDK